MRVSVSAGTPNMMESKTYTAPAQAKNWLKGKIKDREKWAGRYNVALETKIRSIREEFDSLDIGKLPVGEKRSWSVIDDYTKVRFVWQVTKVEE
jgi:hypothetical protein